MAISPIPIIAVVLVLVSPRGRVNGPAYLLGQILGIATAGAVALPLARSVGSTDDGEPAGWTNWLKLILGLALVFLAVKQWRERPRRRRQWMARNNNVIMAVLLLVIGAKLRGTRSPASRADDGS